MNITTRFTLVLLSSDCLSLAARADEIQFTTLPQPAQTTVIRETHIVGPNDVVHVIRNDNGVYAVTVRRGTGAAVVYVNGAGQIVQPVATDSTAQTVIETNQTPSLDTFVHNLDSSRYQLLEKKENEEVYLDKQTGVKWAVKVERKD
jgi:hypothetical protein